MRTAICFSGEFRSLDKTFDILYKNVISKFSDFDIFIFDWDDDPHLEKVDFLLDTLKVKSFHTEMRPTLHPELVDTAATQGMFRQLYCIQQCNLLKRQYEELHNFKYDIVVRIRPDLLLINDTSLPDDIENYDFSKLWVMDHDDWHGYCDRLYFSNSVNMDKITSGYDLLPYYISIGATGFYERFLRFVTHYNDIEVGSLESLKTCLLRVDGTREGELISIQKGIIHRTGSGIWHKKLNCFI